MLLINTGDAGLQFWAERATVPTELFIAFLRKHREIIP
jgi:hypothetical protein